MPVVSGRVQKFLDREMICYETVPHITDFTALETSEHTHTPGREFAKAVIVIVDGDPVMLVLRADHVVDLDELAEELHARDVHLATEHRIRRLFPDCDKGAIPPFGNLYDLPVYASPRLLESETVTCNAGSHEMALRLSTSDFRRLVHPKVLGFSHHI